MSLYSFKGNSGVEWCSGVWFSAEGRNVSENKNAPTFAPTRFEKEDEAKKHRFKKPGLEQAMRDFFRTQRIRVEQYDKPSLGRYRLATQR